MDDRFDSLMRQLTHRVDAAAANPAAVVHGSFEGRSKAGKVTVRVDALGRLEQVRFAPNSIITGDEAAVATALTEAYTAARANAEGLVLAASSGWRDTVPDPPPPRPRRDHPEDDNTDLTILRRH
jgi:DNA-binding protein YbaB